MWRRLTAPARLVPLALLLVLSVQPVPATAGANGVENAQRAKINYMLNCQGCHGPDGRGTADGAVPTMTNFVGKFLNSAEGRQFLVRVPGTANAALDNRQLAELLNWMLLEISPQQIPAGFVPYAADEVGALRKQPLSDVLATRQRLLDALGEAGAH